MCNTILDFFKKKSLKSWILLLIFISFIAKMVIGYSIRDSFFLRGNSHTPLNSIAFNIKDNWEYAIEPGIPSVDYEPIYPIILGISYRIFGANWFGVTLFQATLYGLTSWLLFLIGTKLKDETAGFVAAVYHSFYPYIFFHSLSVFDTTQFIFIVVFLVYAVLFEEERKRKYWQYGLIGCFLGLSLLSRGSALAFWPLIISFLFIKQSPKNFFKRFAFTFVGILLVLAPWLIRNYLLTEKLIISTHGGFGFWQGNNEFSYSYLKNNISLDEIYRRTPPPDIYQKFPLKARSPKEAVEVAQAYTSEAIRYIKENPRTFVKLCGMKFIKFWSWIRNPVRSEYEYGSKKNRQLIYFISYIPLLFLFPMGSYLLFRKSFKNFLLLFGMVVTYTIAHVVVMGFTRTRLPLDPILMLFIGIFSSHLIRLLRFCE